MPMVQTEPNVRCLDNADKITERNGSAGRVAWSDCSQKESLGHRVAEFKLPENLRVHVRANAGLGFCNISSNVCSSDALQTLFQEKKEGAQLVLSRLFDLQCLRATQQAILQQLIEKVPQLSHGSAAKHGANEILGVRIRRFLKRLSMKAEAGARRVSCALEHRTRMVEAAVTFEPKVQLSAWEPHVGDTLAILVTVPPPRGIVDRLQLSILKQMEKVPLVEVRCNGQIVPAYRLASDPAIWRALVASTPLDEPGIRKIVVQVRDGRHRLYAAQVLLRQREFPVEAIWLPQEKVGLKGTDMEIAVVKKFHSRQSGDQHWRLPLVVPCEGEVTTEYGLKRYYNGVFAERYYHRGIDYGADVGEVVLAPAGGQVALVGREREGFALHGNCVGLDHGQGVTSLLLHLDSILVSEGTLVKAGQPVGTVGSTGMATGPHLHWGLFVNGQCVDPKVWMEPQAWS